MTHLLPTRRRTVGALALAMAVPLIAGTVAAPAQAKDKSGPRDIAYSQWSDAAGFAEGTFAGSVVDGDDLVIDEPVGTRSYTDPFGSGDARDYEYATWTAPLVDPGFDLTELIGSWNATTPDGTWLEVEVRGRPDGGGTSKWYILGRWTTQDDELHPTSVSRQGDGVAYVAIDTLVMYADRYMSNYELRVTLLRETGSSATPRVSLVGAMASNLPETKKLDASPSGGAEGIVLDVPTYSQETHIGHYPEYDNGGEAWCSPTSTAMVLDYWGVGPTAEETAWVNPSDADPQVDHAARYVFDHNYDGAGNWPFNTAYAGTRGLEAYVTRLRSLTEAEQFIKAGIPLVVSLSFKESKLDGAGYGTNGHLLVIVGFDADGNVVVNDPASHLIPSNDEVRTTYDREQFENAWIAHSGGVSYVMHPESVPAPPAPDQPNW